MEKLKALLIEDDADILELTKYNLEKEGFVVETAMDGESGFQKALLHKPAIIVLDIMLPGVDGLKVCQKIRSRTEIRNIPIIMLTAKGEESDVVVGLELGADDYVTKPFSPKELVARVRAILRRGIQEEEAPQHIAAGPIVIDPERHEIFHHGAPMTLTLAEFKILRTLASKPGRVFTRDQLLESMAGADTYLVDRNVDVHVRSLRKKLGDDYELIQTIRGVGYKCRD